MRMTSRDRYQHDHTFTLIVDTLRYMLASSDENGKQFTATEVREAAMLACELYEYEHIRPLLLLNTTGFSTALFGEVKK